MSFQKSMAALGVLLLLAGPVYSQKSKAILKAADAALSRKASASLFAKQRRIYDKVLGYIAPLPPMPPHPLGALTAFAGPRTWDPNPGKHLMQVAPFKRPLADLDKAREFVRGDDMTPGELTQAAYLWQLAHPWSSLDKHPYLYQKIQKVLGAFQAQFPGQYVEKLPNLQFLQRMLNPGFKSISYAKWLRIVPVYPKRIVLDEEGLPVKAPQADLAGLLDLYLMLSHPQEMGAFVNIEVSGWAHRISDRPFVLTEEEQEAATTLLNRRRSSDRLPENPTVRDLIEQAYNRLETHTLPYSQVNAQTPATFKAYPNYISTHLFRSVKGVVIGQWPVIWVQNGRHILQNRDTVHLIVLDAVMGGVAPHHYQEVNRTLEAFRELCATTTPTPEHIAHLQLLQQNLRLVFNPLIEDYKQFPKQTYGLTPNWAHMHISYAAWDTLVKQDVRELVGKHLD